MKTLTKKEFNSLSVRKRRVFLAKDVLAQLKAKLYKPIRGGYFYANIKEGSDSKELQKFLQDKNKCEVCAKGGLIASYARNFNSISYRGASDFGGTNIQLKRAVGAEFWDMIEALFESYNYYEPSNHVIKQMNKMKTKGGFSMGYLMRNIVRNKGVLKINGVVVD